MAHLVFLVAVCAVLATILVIIGELIRGHGWDAALIAGISLLIATIPEEFSVVYALYLSLGSWRLTQANALVRNLPSAEALGSVTVICADKTGTLTAGKLEAVGCSSLISEIELFTYATLACEPVPFDPLEVAIVDKARAVGVDTEALHSNELISDWPFTMDGNYLTHTWMMSDGTFVCVTKGSVESLLDNAKISPENRSKIEIAHDEFASQGMRLIAVAANEVTKPGTTREQDEADLNFVGIIAFADPLRDGITDAVADCVAAGIRVVMITGDHPDTALAIAKGMGEFSNHNHELTVTTGTQLEEASGTQLDRIISRTDVFARIKPEQKFMLVQSLQRQGNVVAMTGDGINDAPALRAADIGVAMGKHGTAVAHEAASIVLLDDNFKTIVNAIHNGRLIYENLTKAFAFLIVVHMPIILSAAVVPFIGKPLLLMPLQLVTLEVILHPIVSLVFQAEPAAPDLVRRKPRSSDFALSRKALLGPFVLGVSLSIGVIASYLIALAYGWDVNTSRGLAFCVLIVSQPLLLVILKAPNSWWRSSPNWTKEFVAATFSCIALAIALQYVPQLARLNKFETMPPVGWLVVLSMAISVTLLPSLTFNLKKQKVLAS